MKKIGFTGPFSDSNYGDYAMFINNVLTIDEKNITVFTYQKEVVDKIVRHYLDDYTVKVVEVHLDEEEVYLQQSSKKYQIEYMESMETPDEIEKQLLNGIEIEEAVSELSVLVVSGGGFFNYLWCAKHRKSKLLKIVAPILAAKRKEIKTVFMGNTFGPFTGCKEMLLGILKYADHCKIATRDIYSKHFLSELGFSDDISLLPDDLYFPDDRLNKKEFSEFILPPKYVILELYISMEELDVYLVYIKEMVSNCKKQFASEIVFLPFDVGFGGMLQGSYLKERIPEIYLVTIEEEGYLSYEKCRTLICNAKAVFCNRYHAMVMALANNIPCYMYIRTVRDTKEYYLMKVRGLLDMMLSGQEYDQEMFTALELNDFFKNATDRYEEIVNYQKGFYNMVKYETEKKWLLIRNNYINQYIRGD